MQAAPAALPCPALPFVPSKQPASRGHTRLHGAELTRLASGLGRSRPSASALLHNCCYEENSITEVICKSKCTSEHQRNAGSDGPEVTGWPGANGSPPGAVQGGCCSLQRFEQRNFQEIKRKAKADS